MLRVFSRRLYNEKLFNQVPNVCNNLKNNLSFICCNNNDTSFLNVSKNVQTSPVKVNTNFPNFHVAKRYKQKKDKAAKTKQDLDDEEEEEEEEDWLNDDESLSKDSTTFKFDLPSTRLDFVAKKGFGISRNKIETHFYESKIRINGEKVLKKSVLITVEDKIDLIKGNDILNPENLIIARLEILDMTPKGDNIRFAVRRFKNLVIEDYDEPYKPKSSEY